MKNIHIHRDTYYVSFNYESKAVFAVFDTNEIDHDEEKPVTLVNSYGIPFFLTRREFLDILREDAATDVQQFTLDDYYNDRIPPWEAIEED